MASVTLNLAVLFCACVVFFLCDSRAVRNRRQTQSQMDPLLRAVCTGADGSFPHPYSCGSYVQCYNNTYSEADCPGNMYFNWKTKVCDFRRLVKCKVVDGMVDIPDPNIGPEIPVPQIDHYPLNRPNPDQQQ